MEENKRNDVPVDEYSQMHLSSLVQDVIGAYTQTGEHTDILGSYTGNMRISEAGTDRIADEMPVQDADDL